MKSSGLLIQITLSFLIALSMSSVVADTYNVDSTVDSVDANSTDYVCADSLGRCTLRAAIQQANYAIGADTINIPAGTYTITIGEQDAGHSSQKGDFNIFGDLIINGVGAGATIIDGNLKDRIFHIGGSGGGPTVEISNVTITNGQRSGAVPGGFITFELFGAGIANHGQLTIKNSIISGNRDSRIGGGIWNASTGSLTIENSSISNNRARNGGGGIWNSGTLTVTDSVISGNICGGSGGGISNDFGAPVTITNTEISENIASDAGGGIFVTDPFGLGGTVSITNSAISDNDASSATAISAVGKNIVLTNSTVHSNSSNEPSILSNTTISFKNTIVANKTGTANCSGTGVFTSNGNNIDSDNSCNFNQTSDFPGVDPLLGPLADNGGPTRTRALLAGSPAIDTGDDSACPTTDQRGIARPKGNACDIGSYESAFYNTPPTDVANNELRNISTRADVRTGNDIAIAGFIISGSSQKCVVVRARGPSVGVPAGEARLPDPVLTLKSGQTTIASNDNWQIQSSPGDATIINNLGLAPGDILDAALYTCLDPGAYTALLSGFLNTTGVGIVEVFDADAGLPYLRNISTRAWVGTVNLVTIAGFIIRGDASKQVLIRGRGPSVNAPNGVQVLSDPRLRLFEGNVNTITNNDWQAALNAAEISATGKAPTDARDAAILTTLAPGAYTAILSGVGGTEGMGIVEVFDLTGR